MNFSDDIRDKGVACARGIADWMVAIQYPHSDENPASGAFPWMIFPDGHESHANNWNVAFACMGMLAAHKAFDNPEYESAALHMGRYMKSLQIFDPFKPDMYGSIREMSPQCPWNYTRDTLSVAWAFIELYRYTQDNEYLERAKLWAEWFVNHGLDKEGWPYWGFQYESCFENRKPQMCNDVQGSFQGGSLNFFYHLATATHDERWIGNIFTNMADHFITHIQQDDGFFHSIIRATKEVPDDPQGGLHRANDDLGTLGLLCAYTATNNKRYLQSINKYLAGVFKYQLDNGSFEDSVAGIPVVLNLIYEGKDLIDTSLYSDDAVKRALMALYASQSDGTLNVRMHGGIIEHQSKDFVCARSSCYALIVLLKLFAGVPDFLTSTL